MYSFLHQILSDKKDGELFCCFDGWHIAYMVFFAVLATAVLLFLRKKPEERKTKAARLFIGISFGIMIADFFLMPLAYGEIDIEKLPFHICTAMCVMNFLSYRIRVLEKWRVPLAALGFLSNLIYLVYPAGVMWHQTHPLSYRVIETLSFHGMMCVYGLIVLAFEAKKNNFKTWVRDLAVEAGMTLWALLGNLLYNGDYGGKTHFFNWFFVVQDPFGILPAEQAAYVMPFLNTVLFFALVMVLYFVLFLVKKGGAKEPPAQTKDPRNKA